MRDSELESLSYAAVEYMTHRNYEIINTCFLKPLSFRVICYAAIDNTEIPRNLILFNVVLFFFFFLRLRLWHMEVPGLEAELGLSCWPIPQPW